MSEALYTQLNIINWIGQGVYQNPNCATSSKYVYTLRVYKYANEGFESESAWCLNLNHLIRKLPLGQEK